MLQILRTAHVRLGSALAVDVRSQTSRRSLPIRRRQLANVVATPKFVDVHQESALAATVLRLRLNPSPAPTRRHANAAATTRTAPARLANVPAAAARSRHLRTDYISLVRGYILLQGWDFEKLYFYYFRR